MKRFKVLSLAALVAFAACDEGTEPVVAPAVTGTISGVVTIEGTAKSGVSVTLSSGAAATTDASGAYSFAGVNAGTYTVTISGFPTDVTFTTTTKGATIATSGQVVTVNFDGAYVRTAAILGSVSAGGTSLAGVTVALTGAGTASANTDANGQYAFTGLRAGTYTVTISGFDATQYAFASTTSSVTVGVGQSQVKSFTGTKLATAKITGTVKIDGTGVAGVIATLSTGAVDTTDATGAYMFSNLTAGTYTVTISGYASDAQFTVVSQAVTLTSAGSTGTANFDGAYIKTSSIVGIVTVSGTPLAGVTVTVGTTSVNTDTNGQYTFSSLRAGTYTVTISGWDATMYTFATTAASVTVATGESKVQSFAGAYVATAKISGKLFIDELPKNDVLDSSEATYALSNVVITIEGGAVNNTSTANTNDGVYEFTGLIAGTYRVTITPPAAGTFGWGGTSTSSIVTLTPGGTATVNFPFDILKQYVTAEAFLGKDAGVAAPAGVAARVAPQAGVLIDIYDTYGNAIAAPAAPVLGTTAGFLGGATTSAAGAATVNFLRANDKSPAGATDNIVFAVYRPGQVIANRTQNGETVIEIKYNSQDTLVVAPDEFDLLNGQLIVRFIAKDGMGSALGTWTYSAWERSAGDTTGASGVAALTGLTTQAAPGVATLPTGTGRFIINTVNVPTLGAIDTIYFKLTEAALNNGLTYTQVGTANTYATARGSFLRVIVDGTQPDSITLAGTQTVTYTQGRLVIRSHDEQDDVVKFTAGDPAPAAADPVQYYIYNVNTDGNRGAAVVGPVTQAVGSGVACGFSGANAEYVHSCAAPLTANKTYLVVAQKTGANTIISDTAYTVFLSGKQQADTAKGVQTNGATAALYSSFAWKYSNLQITGVVSDLSATVPATGLKVWVKTASSFVGPSKDTVVTVTAAGGAPCPAATGAYCTFANLLEGPYTVEALDGDSASHWQFKTTLTTASAPVASGTDVTGAVNNTSASKGSRDAQGTGLVAVANFRATRMDTKIQGAVQNDRDGDTNTIDDGEALVGATVELIADADADGVIDSGESVVQTTTTDATGAYEFTALQEGTYIVRASSSTAYVTRQLNGATGAHTNNTGNSGTITTSAIAAAAAPADGANNTMRVGTKTPQTNSAMPAWNYNTDVASGTSRTHFTFLAKQVGIVQGNVKQGAVGKAGVTVILTRCFGGGVAPNSPPYAVTVASCAKIPGTQIQRTTDASGNYSFSPLDEGAYLIEVVPGSVGLTTIATPALPNQAYRATIQLAASPTDTETAPDFVIS